MLLKLITTLKRKAYNINGLVGIIVYRHTLRSETIFGN